MTIARETCPRVAWSGALLIAFVVLGSPDARGQEAPESGRPDEVPTAPTPPEDEIDLQPVKPKRPSRFYVGGWLGASGGDLVELVEVAPEVGYQVSPKFHIGGSLVYRYRKDKRFDPDLTTRNVGGSLFTRYFVYGPLFLHAGGERITWDFIEGTAEGPAVSSADHTAILVGPGFALPMGRRSATYFTVLYDLNYDDAGPNPYDRPWFIRIGVGVGL